MVDGNAHSYVFSGVAGKLTVTLTAVDEAGNRGKTVKKAITIKDVTSPTKVTGLYGEGVNNKTGGVLTWNPATDNVGVTQYLVTVEDENGKKTSYTSKTNSLKLKKLNAGNYKFTVVAVDKAKNKSDTSDIGVLEVKDEIEPKIKKLSAKVNKDNTATVTWNATDETAFGSVKLTLDGEDIWSTSAASGSCMLPELSAGTHDLRLTAYDAAGKMAVKDVTLKIKAQKNAGILAAV